LICAWLCIIWQAIMMDSYVQFEHSQAMVRFSIYKTYIKYIYSIDWQGLPYICTWKHHWDSILMITGEKRRYLREHIKMKTLCCRFRICMCSLTWNEAHSHVGHPGLRVPFKLFEKFFFSTAKNAVSIETALWRTLMASLELSDLSSC